MRTLLLSILFLSGCANAPLETMTFENGWIADYSNFWKSTTYYYCRANNNDASKKAAPECFEAEMKHLAR